MNRINLIRHVNNNTNKQSELNNNNQDINQENNKKRNVICLILTCDKEYYKQRRKRQENTINLLKDELKIYYLVADPEQNEIYKITERWENDIDLLSVKCEESYESLSRKMYLAYSYFYDKDNIDGIIKIDDDTLISNINPINYILYSKYDYIGHTSTFYTKNKYDKFHWKRKLNNQYLYKMMTYIDCNIFYFSGPFYYISKNIIKQIRYDRLEYFAEDLSVGYIVSKYNYSKITLNESDKNYIKWSSDTEDYVKRKLYIYICDDTYDDNKLDKINKIIKENNKSDIRFIKSNIESIIESNNKFNNYMTTYIDILVDDIKLDDIKLDDIKLDDIKLDMRKI